MTTPTLADRFAASPRPTIELDGREVHRVFALPVAGRTTLRIVRERVSGARPQALRLAAAVPLEANGRRAGELALRSTTAPDEVEVLVDAVDDTVVYLWNTWTVDGIEHAWLANAGMHVETDLTGPAPAVRVRCSDGLGEPDFDDLVVLIALLPTPEPVLVHDPPAPGVTAAVTGG